jgi:hypothetical protein
MANLLIPGISYEMQLCLDIRKMNTRTRKNLLSFCLCLAGIFLFNCHQSNGDYKVEVLSCESHYYKELMPIVIKWKDAVLKRNFGVLATLALPDEQAQVKIDLKNKSSDLYRIFYDDRWNKRRGTRSVYEILGNAKELDIVMVKDKWYEGRGELTEVYFYDKSNLKLSFPLSLEDKKLLRRYIWLISFSKDNGQWNATYEFW